MPLALNALYHAIAQDDLTAIRAMLPDYSSWRDQSTALNLAVAQRKVDAVRLLAPRSDVLLHEGQILRTAVFLGSPEMVTVLMPCFKGKLQPVKNALEQAIKERDLPVVQAIWAGADASVQLELQKESLGMTRDATADDVRFYEQMAPLVHPEAATYYFKNVLEQLPAHLSAVKVGRLLEPLAAVVPEDLADGALKQLGRDAMPRWFRHWEQRQLNNVDIPAPEAVVHEVRPRL